MAAKTQEPISPRREEPETEEQSFAEKFPFPEPLAKREARRRKLLHSYGQARKARQQAQAQVSTLEQLEHQAIVRIAEEFGPNYEFLINGVRLRLVQRNGRYHMRVSQ